MKRITKFALALAEAAVYAILVLAVRSSAFAIEVIPPYHLRCGIYNLPRAYNLFQPSGRYLAQLPEGV